MFKIVRTLNVPYFCDFFVKINNDSYPTMSANVNFVSSYKPKTELGMRSFNFRGISLWN